MQDNYASGIFASAEGAVLEKIHIYKMKDYCQESTWPLFVFIVFYLRDEILTLEINILKENDSSQMRNDSPTRNIHNPVGFSNNSIGAVFPLGEWYFLLEVD